MTQNMYVLQDWAAKIANLFFLLEIMRSKSINKHYLFRHRTVYSCDKRTGPHSFSYPLKETDGKFAPDRVCYASKKRLPRHHHTLRKESSVMRVGFFSKVITSKNTM